MFCVLSNLHAQSEWQLQKETDEIKVYFKQSDAETYCVKVETTFPVHYQTLIDEVFENITGYPEWIFRCDEAKLLEKNEDYRILYTVSNIPFPFQDRDVVTKMLHPKIKGKNIILHSYSVPDYIPDKDGYKRQEFINVYWYLTPDETSVKAIYILTIKANEIIPDFILRMLACKGPYESFKKLHERLSEK